jgi:hypothetical protein
MYGWGWLTGGSSEQVVAFFGYGAGVAMLLRLFRLHMESVDDTHI